MLFPSLFVLWFLSYSPHPQPCFYEGTPYLPLLPHCPSIPLCWGIKLSQEQWPLLPLMPDKASMLLYMQLEPWVPPCVLFGWWFSPWKLWVVWLVDIVLPMGLQTPSAPSTLPLTLPLGSPSSAPWLAISGSVSVRLWQNLSGDSYTRLIFDVIMESVICWYPSKLRTRGGRSELKAYAKPSSLAQV